MAVGPNGLAYVAGWSTSDDLPGASPPPPGRRRVDSFVAALRLNAFVDNPAVRTLRGKKSRARSTRAVFKVGAAERVEVSGFARVRIRVARTTRTIVLKSGKRTVPARDRRRLVLRPGSRGQERVLARALRKGRDPRVSARIRFRDRDGASVTKRRRVRLAP